MTTIVEALPQERIAVIAARVKSDIGNEIIYADLPVPGPSPGPSPGVPTR